jgi:hypothetical protein
LILPIALLVVAALSCLGIQRLTRPARPTDAATADSTALPEASQAKA